MPAFKEKSPASWVGQGQEYGLVPVFRFSLGVNSRGGIYPGGYLIDSENQEFLSARQHGLYDVWH